jgi:hypothetical protein
MLSHDRHCAERKPISWMSDTVNFIWALLLLVPFKETSYESLLTVMNAQYGETATCKQFVPSCPLTATNWLQLRAAVPITLLIYHTPLYETTVITSVQQPLGSVHTDETGFKQLVSCNVQ